MNFAEAMQEAARRARATNEQIDVWFNADSATTDWRERYVACRYIDRPAHGRQACTANPDGTFITATQENGRAEKARPVPSARTLGAAPRQQADFFAGTTVPYIDEPYTDYQAVSRLAQHCATVLTRLDAPHVWNWIGIEAEWHDKPSTLQDENGFKLELRYSTSEKRVKAGPDFGDLSRRHRRRDDDPCTATYSPTRPARIIAADVLRRVIQPARLLHVVYVAEEEKRQAKVKRAHEIQDQIIAASQGAFEPSRNDGPDDADLHLYLNRGSVSCHGSISLWSNSVTLERLCLPVDLMLRLAAMIGEHVEARRAAAPAQADDED